MGDAKKPIVLLPQSTHLPQTVRIIERSHIGFDGAVPTVRKEGGFFEDVIIDDPLQIRSRWPEHQPFDFF